MSASSSSSRATTTGTKRAGANASGLDPPGPKQKRRRFQKDENDDNQPKSTISEAGKKVMLQENLLKKIAAALPSSDLQTLRQTCQFWNHGLIPSLRKSQPPLRLISVRNYAGSEGRNLSEFNAAMKTSAEVPFSKYELMIEPMKKTSKEVEEFFTLCGKSTTSLSFKSDGGTERGLNLDLIRQLIFTKLPELTTLELHLDHKEPMSYESKLQKATPKLQQLTLNCIKDKNLHPAQDAFLGDLIKGAVGLNTLVLKDGPDKILPYLPLFVRSVTTFAKRTTTNLSRLEFCSQPSAECMELLNKLSRKNVNGFNMRPLRLKTFLIAIDFNDSVTITDWAAQLRAFLNSQSDCLRLLEINTFTPPHGIPNGVIIPIPKMEALTEFRLISPDRNMRSVLKFDGGSTMNEAFPALQKFVYETIATGECNTRNMNDLDHFAHSGVSSLELICLACKHFRGPHGIGNENAEHEMELLNGMGAVFPSITHLRLAMATRTMQESLPRIWSIWPGLEIANVKYHNEYVYSPEAHCLNHDLDEALSGVKDPPRTTKTFKAKRLAKLTTLDNVRARLAMHKTEPGLSDMTRLRKLVLDFTDAAGAGTFSLGDVGGYFGLAMAPKTFQHFAILRPESDEAAEANLSVILVYESSPGKAKGNNISKKCEAMIRKALGPSADLHFQ